MWTEWVAPASGLSLPTNSVSIALTQCMSETRSAATGPPIIRQNAKKVERKDLTAAPLWLRRLLTVVEGR